ncbi:hypothetical protein [Segeticoccus rhizosphaerae]|jgi:hypothetical protein|uniref:hypothetical protein n=1 Tax=Segeticoccus rhizosphaerae TaxID=1104777 RepID=UPI0010C0FB8B|nr:MULTISPECIES: hypothetical protein [Intrasporangiaceae]
MSTQHTSEAEQQSPGPWFRERPPLTVGASAAMFMAVFVVRLFFGDASDALLILLVFPISLLALTFGTRVGLVAGLVAACLIGLWAWIDGVNLSLMGWLSRIGPLLFLGVLVGDAADRLKRADEERQCLAIAQLRHRQAVQVNDSLIQGMASAKWSLESGRPDTAATTLEETIATGQRLVSDGLRAADADTPRRHGALAG